MIDLLCPFVKGGRIGVVGETGIGLLVLVEEVVRRLKVAPEGVSLFTLIRPVDVAGAYGAWTQDPLYTGGTAGSVQTFYIPSDDAGDARCVGSLGFLDGVAYITRGLALLGLYPAVDPVVSTSRALDPALVGEEHRDVAQRVRQELHRFREFQGAGAERERLREPDRLGVARARKLQRFLTQPFFVAEPWTKWPGKSVPRAATLQGCRAILEGAYDELPEEAFTYIGSVEEAVEKAREIGP